MVSSNRFICYLFMCTILLLLLLLCHLQLLRDSAISRHFAKHIDPMRDSVLSQHHMDCFECTLQPDCVWNTTDMTPSSGYWVEILLYSHYAYHRIEALLYWLNTWQAHLMSAMSSLQLYLLLISTTSLKCSVIYYKTRHTHKHARERKISDKL